MAWLVTTEELTHLGKCLTEISAISLVVQRPNENHRCGVCRLVTAILRYWSLSWEIQRELVSII